MKSIQTFLTIIMLLTMNACTSGQDKKQNLEDATFEVKKSDAEWKNVLTAKEYHILRERGTERAFTGDLWDNKTQGTYYCAACDLAVFSSETKFKSGSGWPSFYQPVTKENVLLVEDRSSGMVREEVVCARCGGHLGHVFPDGPEPTGLRYCINSAALDFTPEASN